jgi:hypothetical protein
MKLVKHCLDPVVFLTRQIAKMVIICPPGCTDAQYNFTGHRFLKPGLLECTPKSGRATKANDNWKIFFTHPLPHTPGTCNAPAAGGIGYMVARLHVHKLNILSIPGNLYVWLGTF